MEISRRQFAALTSIAAIGVMSSDRRVLARSARFGLPAAGTYFDWKPAGEGAWVGMGEGGNTLIVASKGEMMLVDTKFAAFSSGLRREAEATAKAAGDAKLTLVINTHHHGDHTGGNIGFSADLPIIAQEKAKPRIISQLDRYKQTLKGGISQLGKSDKPEAAALLEDAMKLGEQADSLKAEQWAPTKTFASDHELTLGERKVTLRHFGTGHTDNDAIVHIPSLNLIHAGDLLFHKLHPVMDVSAGSNSKGWIESVTKIAELCDDKTVVVPGHGEITDKLGLLGQITYFEKIRAAVEAAIGEGKSREDVMKLTPDEFKSFGNDGRRPVVLGAIFDEIKAAK